MLPVLFLVLVLGAGDTRAGCEHPCPGAPTTQQPGRDSRARLGTLPARRQRSCLAPAQGPAGQGCWRVLGAAGAVPAQLSLSVTLPVTVPLGSAPPPAPRYGADPGALGPRGAHVRVRMGRVGGTKIQGALKGLWVGGSQP